jgi:hypothetical protein
MERQVRLVFLGMMVRPGQLVLQDWMERLARQAFLELTEPRERLAHLG